MTARTNLGDAQLRDAMMEQPTESSDKSGIMAILGTGLGFAVLGIAVVVSALAGMMMMMT